MMSVYTIQLFSLNNVLIYGMELKIHNFESFCYFVLFYSVDREIKMPQNPYLLEPRN